MTGVQIPAGVGIFIHALGLTQSPVQWVPGGSFPGSNKTGRPGRKPRLDLLPRLRMDGSLLHAPYTICWHDNKAQAVTGRATYTHVMTQLTQLFTYSHCAGYNVD
jgi:hypothetical protein